MVRTSGDLATTREDSSSRDSFGGPAIRWATRIQLLDGIANPVQAVEADSVPGVDHEFYEAGGVQIELGAELDPDEISVAVEYGTYRTDEGIEDGRRYPDTSRFQMSAAADDRSRIEFSDNFGFKIDAVPYSGTDADPTPYTNYVEGSRFLGVRNPAAWDHKDDPVLGQQWLSWANWFDFDWSAALDGLARLVGRTK